MHDDSPYWNNWREMINACGDCTDRTDCSDRYNRWLNRSGTLWERESFDHLIRSIEHYEADIEYLDNNPVVAGLCEGPEDWRFRSARFALP